MSSRSAGATDGAILVLGATALETAGLLDHPGAYGPHGQRWPDLQHGSVLGTPVLLAASGVGKANAAAAVASVAAGWPGRVAGVLQLGIGGAYPGSGLALGDVTLAHSEFDLDLGVGARPDWSGLESLGFPAFVEHHQELNRLGLESELLQLLRDACALASQAFATSDSVTHSPALAAAIAEAHQVAVESMEGVAAAQAAAAFALPFIELRAISNLVDDRDKRRWRVAEAVAAVTPAARVAVKVMWEHLTGATKEAR